MRLSHNLVYWKQYRIRSINKGISRFINLFTALQHKQPQYGRDESTEPYHLSLVFSGAVCIVSVINGLIAKYQSHLTYTELKSKITDKNFFPSITFCEETLLWRSYFSYCGQHISQSGGSSKGCAPGIHKYPDTNVKEVC